MQDKPKIAELGSDLHVVSDVRKVVALLLPFLLFAAALLASNLGTWFLALPLLAALCFFSYPSVSHDLVHRTYRLPRRLNRFLLSLIVGISLRSGTAFLIVHRIHHRSFPSSEDMEGRAARLTWWRALLEGVSFQQRSWVCAYRHAGISDRRWLIGEAVAIACLCLLALILVPDFPQFAVCLGVLHLSSWIFPFMTAYLPHRAVESGELEQTRRFRGRILSIIACEHLYHLEHHLYPSVPHQNWPELARRLDSYLDGKGVKPLTLGKH